MSTEPISNAELRTLFRPNGTLQGPITVMQCEGMLARIRALEAECEALRAEVARKDEALRQIADPRNWEEQDRARSIARAALGPWRPTHQHYKGEYYRAHASGFMGWAHGNPVVILENEDGIWIVVRTSEFAEEVQEFDDDGMFTPPVPCYRPLTPDEQAAYVEAAMGERT